MLSAVACLGAGSPSPPEESPAALRLAFTRTMFTGVNENDARAAIQALSALVSQERGIPMGTTPPLASGFEDVMASALAGEVDAIGMTTAEYALIAGTVRFDRFLMAIRNNDPTEEYVVLVHRASGLNTLADLCGRSLVRFANARMSLGPVWLEVQLAKAGLPPLSKFLLEVPEAIKSSKAVLDVFFKRTDACLTTRRSFATLTEMNPQVGAQLVELAASPAFVPSVFAFRADFETRAKQKSIEVMTSVHSTPFGQQALTIFQVGQVAERPFAALESALALLGEYASLRRSASGTQPSSLTCEKPATATPLP